MTPQELTLYAGGDFVLSLTMDDPPEGGVGDWAMRFRVRDEDRAEKLALTSGSGVTVTDPTAGVWRVAGTAGEDWPPGGLYTWSFWRVDGGDDDYPVAYGTAVVVWTG